MRCGAAIRAEQILSLEVLHREIRLALVLAEVVDRDDVLVRELAGGARLAEESLAELGVLIDRRRDDLDGDDPLEQRVAGAIHDTHATLAEFFEKLVAADVSAWVVAESPNHKTGRKRGKLREMRMIAAANTAHKPVAKTAATNDLLPGRRSCR